MFYCSCFVMLDSIRVLRSVMHVVWVACRSLVVHHEATIMNTESQLQPKPNPHSIAFSPWPPWPSVVKFLADLRTGHFEGTHMIRFATFCFISIFASSVFADSIALRSAVRLTHDDEHVRLADVADLDGEAAVALGDVVLDSAPRTGEVLELSLAHVRAALDDAGVHWGTVHLSGRGVIVRASNGPGSSPRAMTPVSLEQKAEAATHRKPEAQLAADLLDDGDLRSAISEYLTNRLSVSPHRLRMTFDPRDASLLETSLSKYRFEIEPVSSVHSSRVDLALRTWQGDRIVDRRTVCIQPTILMNVAVLTRDIDRGGSVTADDVEMLQQWHPPSHGSAALLGSAQDTAGRSVVTRLREGTPLRESHFQRETLVRRGELVQVRCVVGGAVISLQAEARASATEGETIEFRKPGERETFLATVTGKGAAIVDLAKRK